MRLAKELGIVLKSFVFPEDKVGHIDILKRYGFEAYRSPLPKAKYANRSLPMSAVKVVMNRIIAPPVQPIWMDGIWEVPSSMTFYDPLIPFTLVLRAKNGVRKAIKEGRIFHIFLHPENLLAKPSLENKLDRFFAFTAERRDKGDRHYR